MTKIQREKNQTSKSIISIIDELVKDTNVFYTKDLIKKAESKSIPKGTTAWQINKLKNLNIISQVKPGEYTLSSTDPIKDLEKTVVSKKTKRPKAVKAKKVKVVNNTIPTSELVLEAMRDVEGTFTKHDISNKLSNSGITRYAVEWHMRKLGKEGVIEKVPYPEDYEGSKIRPLYKLTDVKVKESDNKLPTTRKIQNDKNYFNPEFSGKITKEEMGDCLLATLNHKDETIEKLRKKNNELRQQLKTKAAEMKELNKKYQEMSVQFDKAMSRKVNIKGDALNLNRLNPGYSHNAGR